ncbi:MAG: ABC transporter permease [Deltaproteobacteria bacterium]
MSARKPSAVSGITLIVKRELGQYATTWIGYVIMAALLLVCGLLYNAFALGSSPKYSADVLSDYFFFTSGCTIVVGLLLSMRLVAEERDRGTLPLLATSYLSDGQLVVAKFLSAFSALSVWLVFTLYMPAMIFINGKVSVGHIFAGYLGLLLLGAVSVSIGLFGSSLVKSQFAAFVIGAVITVVFLLLWMTSRVVDGALGDFISYLALHDKHFRPFMDGTVTTSAVVFYLSLTFFFLTLSRNALEGRRWRP